MKRFTFFQLSLPISGLMGFFLHRSKWQKAVRQCSQLSLCSLLLACVPQPQPVPVVSASASLAPTVSPPAPTPKASTFQTPAPAPTSTVPPDAIRVSSEVSGGYLYCQKQELPEKVVLRYPTDLAVTPDGKTVYAINTACQSSLSQQWWTFYLYTNPLNFPKPCLENTFDYVRKRSYVYRIEASKNPEILTHNGEPLLSCVLGLDLEMDEAGALYLTDALNQRLYRYYSQNLQLLLNTYDVSGAHSMPAPQPDGRIYSPDRYFSFPYLLKADSHQVLFEVSASGDTRSDSEIRSRDLLTGQQKTLGKGNGGDLLYVVKKGAIYYFLNKKLSNQQAGLIRMDSFPFEMNSGKGGMTIQLHWESKQDIVPFDLVVDTKGVFYFSDIQNHKIWSMTLNPSETEGELKLIAGSGQAGYHDGKGEQASFSTPTSLSVDAAGNLYVADTGNSAIRKVTPEGVVTTFYKAPD